MSRFDINWKRVREALRNDAKTFRHDIDGQAGASPKTMLIGTGIALVSALVLMSMVKSPSIAAPNTEVAIQLIRAPAASYLYDFRTDSEKSLAENAASNTVRLSLKSGQSLGPLLQKNNVDPNTAYAATQAFSTAYNPKNLRVGQKINLYFNADNTEFTGLTLKPNKESTIFVDRLPDGSFKARNITAEFQKELVRVDSQIENSLYLDAQALGAPDKVIAQFAQIYAHSVDFQRDIRAGDKFELLFEVYRDHRGNTIKAGDLVYTSFSPRSKTSSYYLYAKSNGREGYYDQSGKGAKRMLMRTPVNGARLSSRYGTRRHPVLGYRKKHKGVDFAAPRGTPIMAAGSGTIVRASRYGSFGNYVRIRHSDSYSTAYAHMSKFARGIKKGRRVIQGQTIGYVGATGRVTGAHLHYEVLKNGRQINPMSLSTLSGKPLKKAEIPAFKKRAAEIDLLRTNAPSAIEPAPILSAELEQEPDNYVILPTPVLELRP
ncbi:MAG: peptidase M23 [Robiginitomaculum sp.]|nr:MAG: peptidase M23 [Robiginitomaculum sp.]